MNPTRITNKTMAKEDDGGKVYYTIGEVANMLGEAESCVRYWNREFASYVKPHRNKKDNRLFTQRDIASLRSIRYLLRERGMTIAGARECLAAARRTKKDPKATDVADTSLAVKSEVIGKLTEIKSMLTQISSYL